MPSGLNAAASTGPVWLEQRTSSLPLLIAHKLSVRSRLAVATVRPSGECATAVTLSPWRKRVVPMRTFARAGRASPSASRSAARALVIIPRASRPTTARGRREWQCMSMGPSSTEVELLFGRSASFVVPLLRRKFTKVRRGSGRSSGLWRCRVKAPLPLYSGERGWGEGVHFPGDAGPLTPNPSPPSTGERGARTPQSKGTPRGLNCSGILQTSAYDAGPMRPGCPAIASPRGGSCNTPSHLERWSWVHSARSSWSAAVCGWPIPMRFRSKAPRARRSRATRHRRGDPTPGCLCPTRNVSLACSGPSMRIANISRHSTLSSRTPTTNTTRRRNASRRSMRSWRERNRRSSNSRTRARRTKRRPAPPRSRT